MHIKKYRDILVELDRPAVNTGVRGQLRAILRNAEDMRVVYDSGWFDNLITNYGLPQLFNGLDPEGIGFSYAHVGSSAQAPAFTDTTLYGHLGAGTPLGTTYNANQGAPNYEGREIKGWRFAAGVATGTLREVGISYQSVSNTGMMIRQLLTPEIVKASNQILDLYYRFECFPDLGDTTGVVDIGGINYNWTARHINVQGLAAPYRGVTFVPAGSLGGFVGYTGNIVAVTGTVPSGSSITGNVAASPSWDGSSTYCDGFGVFTVDQANGGTIRSVLMLCLTSYSGPGMGIQVQFGKVSDDSPIQEKDSTKQLDITFRRSWSRH